MDGMSERHVLKEQLLNSFESSRQKHRVYEFISEIRNISLTCQNSLRRIIIRNEGLSPYSPARNIRLQHGRFFSARRIFRGLDSSSGREIEYSLKPGENYRDHPGALSRNDTIRLVTYPVVTLRSF
jgi:hypothetical protein